MEVELNEREQRTFEYTIERELRGAYFDKDTNVEIGEELRVVDGNRVVGECIVEDVIDCLVINGLRKLNKEEAMPPYMNRRQMAMYLSENIPELSADTEIVAVVYSR